MSPSSDDAAAAVVTISAVFAEDFGKWHGERLDLGIPGLGSGPSTAPGMTVVFGPNQAGKSTFATLIQWLIAGPRSGLRHGDVAHLAEPGRTLRGSMEGSIGTTPFSVDGSFRIMAKGPIRASLDVTEGAGVDLIRHDLDSWVTRLRGTDAEVVDSVYFLWGADLHRVSDIDAQLSGVSMGQLRGGNPLEVIAALDAIAKRHGAAGGGSAVSVTTVQKRINELEERLTAALGNRDEYLEVQRRLHEASARADEAASERDRYAEELAAISTAISAVSVLDRVRGLRAELDDLPVVTDGWQEVLAERKLLSSIDKSLTAAEEDSLIAEHRARTAAESLGVSLHELARITISDTDANTATTLVGEWRGAIRAHRDASSALEDVLSDLAAARERRDRAVGELTAVDPTDLGTVRLGPGEHREIMGRIVEAEAAHRAADEARHALELASIDHDHAVQRHDRALESWHDRHGPIGPSEWMAELMTGGDGSGVVTAARATGTRTSRPWQEWLGVAAMVAVAAVAVGMRQWVIALVAAVAVVVTALVHLSRAKRLGRPAGQSGTMQPDVTALGVDAATEVAEARRVVDEKTIALSRARHDVELLTERADSSTQVVRDVASSYGVHLAAPLVEIRAELDRWSAAVDSENTYDEGRLAHQRASAALERASRDVAEIAERISTHLRSLGLVPPDEPGSAPDLVAAFRGARSAFDDHVSAAAVLEELRQNWHRLTGPVAGSIEGWSRRRILDELERLGHDAVARRDLESEMVREESRLEGHVANPRVAAILDGRPTPADLEVRRSRATERHAEAISSADTERERVGALSDRLEQLASLELVAELRARMGGLVDEQEELVVEACAAAVASRLLGEVADDYQRRNQPELVRNTATLATRVTDDWRSIRLTTGGSRTGQGLLVERNSGELLPAAKLSTGAKGLLQLALRLSSARSHLGRLGLSIPLICDDPFVHFSDDWARSAMTLLADEARTRQVILFTCHPRTVEAAKELGANVVRLDPTERDQEAMAARRDRGTPEVPSRLPPP